MTLVDALIIDTCGEQIEYVAGKKAPKGAYLNVESGKIVDLDDDDVLPASLDGHIAAYVAAPRTWGEVRLSSGVTGNRQAKR